MSGLDAAYDNAMAESFVDSFKTELIRDRVWQTTTHLELAIVEWLGWYNNISPAQQPRLPPTAEYETLYAPKRPPAATLESK